MEEFWCAALGYRKMNSGEGWSAIGEPSRDVSNEELIVAPQPPAVAFVLVPETKSVKNRLHLDLTPVDRDQQEEVSRLEALGARRVDIGQLDAPWVVMADPEDNEFCVMPRAGGAEQED